MLYILADKGCEILLYGCLWSSTTHITEDARLIIFDALFTLSFRMWLGAWVCLFCTSRRLIHWKWTVTYQCQCFTTNSSISECDNTCETRNPEPEIWIDESSQTWLNPQVDGYGLAFGLPIVSRSGFWTRLEPNRPVFAVQTRTTGGWPGPVANSTQESSSQPFQHLPNGLGHHWFWFVSCSEISSCLETNDFWKTPHKEVILYTDTDAPHMLGVVF